MFFDLDNGQAGVPPEPAPQAHGVSDAGNPAARAFAMMRLKQLVRSGLLGGMPTDMSDPTAVWRGLSQGLGGNAPALAQFQAAAQPAPVEPHEHALAGASPRYQLEQMARAKAVASTMQHLRKIRPYEGRH